jgi:hypothetical protein
LEIEGGACDACLTACAVQWAEMPDRWRSDAELELARRPWVEPDLALDDCLIRRGPRWAEMAHRCKTEPEFALAIFGQLKTDRAREVFLRMYGSRMLRGAGSTIASVRSRVDERGPYVEPEWTCRTTILPPPPDEHA